MILISHISYNFEGGVASAIEVNDFVSLLRSLLDSDTHTHIDRKTQSKAKELHFLTSAFKHTKFAEQISAVLCCALVHNLLNVVGKW